MAWWLITYGLTENSKVYPVITEGWKDTRKVDDGIENFIESDVIISAIKDEAWIEVFKSNEENTKW